MDRPLKAPFPWFGGKSRVADIVWPRFGDCPNYVEPFFGSGAILGPSPTFHIGLTAVFLDPPYSSSADRDPDLYACEDDQVAHAVREWAIKNGSNAQLRIALCGYDTEHEMPPDWECVAWKTSGGYAVRADGKGKANAHRERIWFSPHCLKNTQPDLFQVLPPAEAQLTRNTDSQKERPRPACADAEATHNDAQAGGNPLCPPTK